MEILLWLVPPAVVTAVAMAWVGWLGRAGRGQIGREEAARRMGVALDRDPRVAPPATPTVRERSTGVAVRRRADLELPNPELPVPELPVPELPVPAVRVLPTPVVSEPVVAATAAETVPAEPSAGERPGEADETPPAHRRAS